MLWMTLWPLTLGFALSGIVQSFVTRTRLRRVLGRNSPAATVRASFLGVISSSCSYAASAMARALFERGATFSNAMIFMIASTNLVVELGIVLYILLGWQYLVGEFIGGFLMIGLLAVILPRVIPPRLERTLRKRVTTPPPDSGASVDERPSWRSRQGWVRAARFSWGDLTMLRKELFIGFLVAGFLSADLPVSWWHHLFLTGHGTWTVAENLLVAPLLAVLSFVCSVGNIPLAAAMWSRGVSFGGVIAFIFADLVTLPLLLIYRRFYGTRVALRILVTFWFAMSAAGALVQLFFHSLHALPPRRTLAYLDGTFDLGWTLGLNVAALLLLLVSRWLLRGQAVDAATAVDPVCGMQVHRATAPAQQRLDGTIYYFCSPRCAERFLASPGEFLKNATASVPESSP